MCRAKCFTMRTFVGSACSSSHFLLSFDEEVFVHHYQVSESSAYSSIKYVNFKQRQIGKIVVVAMKVAKKTDIVSHFCVCLCCFFVISIHFSLFFAFDGNNKLNCS